MRVFIQQKVLTKTLKTWCSLSVRVFVNLSNVKLSTLTYTDNTTTTCKNWMTTLTKQILHGNQYSINSNEKSVFHTEGFKIINSILWSLLSLPKIGEMKLKVLKSSTSNWQIMGTVNQLHENSALLSTSKAEQQSIMWNGCEIYEEVHAWHWVKGLFSKLCGADYGRNREVHLLRSESWNLLWINKSENQNYVTTFWKSSSDEF